MGADWSSCEITWGLIGVRVNFYHKGISCPWFQPSEHTRRQLFLHVQDVLTKSTDVLSPVGTQPCDLLLRDHMPVGHHSCQRSCHIHHVVQHHGICHQVHVFDLFELLFWVL